MMSFQMYPRFLTSQKIRFVQNISKTITRQYTTAEETITNSETVSWSRFFQLKKSRRTWERTGATLLGAFSFFGGSFYFGAVADFDPVEPVFGVIDPNIAYGGASFLVGAAGLLGGLVGNPIF